MADNTEVGTAYVAILPSAKGFAKSLKKSIAKEFSGSDLDKMIADALSGSPVTLPVRPEFKPGDLPDELPTRPGREPTLPVKVDPVTEALRDDLRKQLAAITKEITANVEVTPDTDSLRTELSAAITAIEANLTADIPTEPGDRREYERQLREQVDAVSRTVRARLDADVHVDADQPGLRGEVDVAGQTVGRSLATSITSALTSGMGVISGPVVFGGLLVAAAVTAPLIGATIAAGVLAALGGGVIGVAFAALAQDPLMQRAASGLAGTIQQTLAKAAGPLLGTEEKPGPILLAMETLTDLVVELGPSLEQMFASIGPYIPTLAAGLAEFVRAVMPGLLDAVEASGPVLEAIAFNMGPLGESLGRFLSVMADLAPAAISAISVLTTVITSALDLAGGLLFILGAAFGGIYGWYEDLKKWTSDLWSAITGFFSGGGRDVQRRIEALVGMGLRLFRGFWDRLTGGARAALNTLTGFFGGLPGRIRGALGNPGSVLYQAGRNIIQGLINGLRSMLGPLEGTLNFITNRIPDWKGPMDRDRRLLEPSGAAIMGGLIRGIGGQVPALRSQLGSVTDLIAGAPLAAAPVAPYGLTTAAPAPAVPTLAFGGDAPDSFMRWVRENVRVDYGGSPDAAFGS